MDHPVYDLIDSNHPVWNYLEAEDMGEALRQLESGEHPETVTRRLFDWAAQYSLESGAFDAEIAHLHANQ